LVCAGDVCDILELNSNAVRRLDEDEKNTLRLTYSIPTRGNPNVIVINESGLYSLILRSRKPEAKAFKRWVTHEVLPSIRKTGGYIHWRYTCQAV
jgi:anti-repressor protein